MARRAGGEAVDPDGGVLPLSSYEQLFARANVAMLAIDHGRRAIVNANTAALDLLGLDAAQVLGHPANDLLLQPSPDRLLRIRALRGEETAAIREVHSPLGVRTVELNVVPSGTGQVAFAVVLDLTDELDAATRANARSTELATMASALRTIAARLAHDLRGPMAAVAGFADLLLHDQDMDPQQRADLLRRISASTRALAAMAASILGEADSGPARPEDVSFEVADLFDALRAINDAELTEVGGTLETTAQLTTLPVPIGAIRQAVVNLVANSIKYRDPSRPLHIRVAVLSGPDGTEIVVRDNGRGLPDDPAQLFDAGARGMAAEGTPGAGLGLAFVRAEVESVGGSVEARAVPDGAEFVIHLDLPGDDADDGNLPSDSPSSRLSAPQLERLLDATPIATLVIDLSLREIVRVNAAAIRLLGHDEAEIVGHPAREFLDDESVADALRRRLMEEPTGRDSVRTLLRTPDGPRPAEIWLALIEGTALAVAQALAVDAPAS